MSDWPPEVPDDPVESDAPHTTEDDERPVDEGFESDDIESDAPTQGADPDLVADADLEQGRGEDPDMDPSARERQEGL